MMVVLTQTSSSRDVDLFAGGKGRGLYRLTQHGLPVPSWAVIGAPVFRGWLARVKLDARIEELLSNVTSADVERVAAKIEQLLVETELDAETREAIHGAMVAVGAVRVAIRSSGAEEDGKSLSFAGQFSSFLNVTSEAEARECVKKCWASAYSARCLGYRIAQKLPLRIVDMAVVVQEMVCSEQSGVVFTVNPVNGRHDEMLLSSVYGMGEGLVSGEIDADTITLDRMSGRVKETVCGEKEQRYDYDLNGSSGLVMHDVAETDRAAMSVSDHQIAGVHALARKVESAFGEPQDIEWCIEKGNLWLVQSRPITTVPPAGAANDANDASSAAKATTKPRLRPGDGLLWDNSNIIESYSDITSPMTFSFARHAYHRVFREYARLLGMSGRDLDEMDGWTYAMLGQHKGRVYYNLLNWYKIVRLVPFYGINRKALEMSIGAEESLDDEKAEALRPWPTDSRAEEIWMRARSAALFAWYFFTIERKVRAFVKEFYEINKEIDVSYAGLPPEEIFSKLWPRLEELLPKWGGMIILEQTLSLSIGVLDLLVKRWLPDQPASFLFALAKPNEVLESMLPAHEMARVASIAAKTEKLKTLLETAPLNELHETLAAASEPAFAEFLKEVDKYIEEFGYRAMNELKLEEPDMKDDPSIFFTTLRTVLATPDAMRADEEKKSVDAVLEERLPWWKRTVIGVVRGKVQRALAARERVRFCRTRAFGTVRRMLVAMGTDMAETGLLASKTDVFFLRLEELSAWLNGIIGHREATAIIEMRRTQQEEHRKFEAPGRFWTYGVISDADLLECGWELKGSGARSGPRVTELCGTGCSPGVAEAAAEVVTEPYEVAGKVLVTYRTDPGWCTVLPSAAALLVERGSPLTHVAVVARELGIPTVMQVKNLTKQIESGMKLRVDGTTGRIAVL